MNGEERGPDGIFPGRGGTAGGVAGAGMMTLRVRVVPADAGSRRRRSGCLSTLTTEHDREVVRVISGRQRRLRPRCGKVLLHLLKDLVYPWPQVRCHRRDPPVARHGHHLGQCQIWVRHHPIDRRVPQITSARSRLVRNAPISSSTRSSGMERGASRPPSVSTAHDAFPVSPPTGCGAPAAPDGRGSPAPGSPPVRGRSGHGTRKRMRERPVIDRRRRIPRSQRPLPGPRIHHPAPLPRR